MREGKGDAGVFFGDANVTGWSERRRPEPSTATAMPPSTDYVRHAARLARKIHLDSAMGGTPAPDTEFFKTLAKALEEIAAGMEQIGKRE